MAVRNTAKGARRWIGRLVAVVATGTGLAWLLAIFPWIQAASKYDKALAAAKSAGVVTTEAEFVEAIGDMNPKALAAAARLASNVRDRGKKHAGILDTAMRTQETKAVGEVLTIFSPAVDAAVSLGENPGVMAERDYSDPFTVTFPEYSDIKFGGKLLGLRIGLRAEEGDLAGVLSDLAAMDGLAKSASAEPTLIGQLISASLSTTRLDAIVRAAGEFASDPSALRTLRKFAEMPLRADTDRASIGESYVGVYIAENFSKEFAQSTSISPEHYLPKYVPIGLVRKAYAARLLELHAQVALAPKGEKWRVLVDARNAATQGGSGVDQIVEHTVPAMEGMAVTILSSRTKVAIAEALLRIAEIRAGTGSWPKGWDAVPGGAPVSPMGGAPLRFKVEGEKLTVYSIGLDGADETAKAPMLPEKSDDVEYVWTAVG